MTKDEALKMAIDELMKALKLLQRFEPQIVGDNITAWTVGLRNQLSDLQHTLYNNGLVETIKACKEALEQPAQEPVAIVYSRQDGYIGQMVVKDIPHKTKLYTHPAPSWQGLSDDEINDIKTKAIIGANGMSVEQLLGLIVSLTEQALKEKNDGTT